MGVVTAANIKLGVQNDQLKREMREAVREFERIEQVNKEAIAQFRIGDRVNRQYNRGIGRMNRNLQSLGSTLTFGVTLPMTLLGIQSGRTFAQLERLEIGIGAIEQSATLSEIALKDLIAVSKLPGLGIQEANQFYLALRNVNISGEQAIRTIKALGNAVALGGGGREQLGSLALQLPQLISKNKVTQEDLRPIINSSPALGGLIQETFGTLDTSDIQAQLEAAGKSSRDFVAELVAQAEKLNRVESGWSNALENIEDSTFRLTAELGRSAVEGLSLVEMADKLVVVMDGVASSLNEADPATKAFVTGLGGITATVPVVILGIGTIQTMLGTPWKAGLASARRAWLLFTGALAGPGITSFLALAAAGGAVIYMIHRYVKATDTAIDKTELLNEANDLAVESYGGQVTKLESLVAAVKDANTSEEERIKIAARVAEITGKSTKVINEETIANGEATESIEGYIEALKAKSIAESYEIIARQKRLEIIRLENASLATQVTFMDGLFARLQNFGQLDTDALLSLNARAAEIKAAKIAKLNKEIDLLNQNLKKTLKDNNLKFSDLFGDDENGGGGNGAGEELKRLAKLRVELARSTNQELQRLEVDNIQNVQKRLKAQVQLEYDNAVESKQREYRNARMPLDELYFNWLREQNTKLKNDLAEIDKRAFSDAIGAISQLTKSAVPIDDYEFASRFKKKDFGDQDVAKAGRAIMQASINSRLAADNFALSQGLISSTFAQMGLDMSNYTENELKQFTKDYLLFQQDIKAITSQFAADIGLGLSSVVGEIVTGTKSIQNVGEVLLQSLSSMLAEIARQNILIGIATGNPALIARGVLAGVGSGIGRGLANRQAQKANVEVQNSTRLRGQDIYNSGAGTVRLNSF